ncbi:hypothetical protein [Inquilinus limosus]|uniref:hypothetical protein n=1 Tax=Inquilinus limosus TaxID=171674 RepID=UPI0007E8E797|nr:hypothetical protein [Inquilinus limosus]
MSESSKPDDTDGPTQDRREFLSKCGRFAVITPPAVTMLLSTSLTSEAIAKSGGKGRRSTGFAEWRPSRK